MHVSPPRCRRRLAGGVSACLSAQEAGASLAARDSKGNQPLHHAATGASADLLQTLVRSGARTDATNAAGETPLHIAAKCKTVTTIKALVKAGANVRPMHPHCSRSAVHLPGQCHASHRNRA